ncbi:conjugal transfer protein TraB, partial [Vibrio cyclitrophicus]
MLDKQKDALGRFKKRVFKDTDGDFEDGGTINAVTRKRNRTITLTVLLILTALAFVVWRLTLSPQAPSKGIQDVGFGAVVTDDFTDKDNQSALTFQQDKINQIEQSLARFEGTLSRFGQSLTSELENIKKANERDTKSQLTELEQQMQQKLDEVDALKAQLETQLASTLKAGDPSTQHGIETNQGDTFGQYKLPPRP